MTIIAHRVDNDDAMTIASLMVDAVVIVVSTFSTSPSTRVLGLVAKVLTTKVKNEGSVTYVRNPRAIPCNT
jgi:hypothetical protein